MTQMLRIRQWADRFVDCQISPPTGGSVFFSVICVPLFIFSRTHMLQIISDLIIDKLF
jgi:hypothetical protein